jgi:NTP pyrophosphatase (non-canonical NTP hydrolase)
MASQIQELTEEIRRLCTEKGWRRDVIASKTGYEFAAYIALAHSELSEALEAYRDKVWSDTKTIIKASSETEGALEQKPVGVGPELADVIIRIIDMCDIWGINIEYELERVIAYGWTRPYKHGGRQL